MNKDHKHQHACLECDLLITMPDVISHRTNVHCPRCDHSIAFGHNNARQYILAMTITALILMFVACSFSFISFSSSGQVRSINLLQTFTELYAQEYYFVAILVFAFIILLPTLYLVAIMLIIFSSYRRVEYLPTAWLGVMMSYILPWSMAEVFLIGVLVALIKMISMADIALESSFWAYVLFAPLFTHIVSVIDNHRLWRWIEQGKVSIND
ncbi:paraquat-inducible protein A [Glaciecola sp.]|jgi:paraquat-inducible protein A|uniref:paraquat-inducible protein A n=1 Tax=Glaciecola sp. MF2-115 TaxID=3384827 RepID=UPI003988B736